MPLFDLPPFDLPLLDLPLLDLPLLDLPLFDLPLFDLPLFDLPLFDLPLFDLPLFDLPLFDLPLLDVPPFDLPLLDLPLLDLPLLDLPLLDLPLFDLPPFNLPPFDLPSTLRSRPSRTARMVTFGRAIADAGASRIPNFRDPTARVFLTQRGRSSVDKIERAAREGRWGLGVEGARAMADMMALRTLAIDAAVRAAVAAGARQLVILGAGFDGRAWRMPELAGVKVFEVDHPATQGDKRARVAELPPAIGSVNFTPTNFESEPLGVALDRAGHDRRAPTCWIWEGVVMYLTRDAMYKTLEAIAERSASGSTLIVNYHTAHRGFLASLIFRLIGEPMISAWSPDEMAAVFNSVGFVVREDTGMLDWSARFADGKGNVKGGTYMRVVVAQT